MALDKIVERILQDAREEAAQVESKAAADVEAILERARSRGKELKKRLVEEARREAEGERRRIVVEARLESQRRLLTVKRELIDQVFDKAAERLAAMQEGEREKWLEKLILSAVRFGDEEILVNEDDARLVERLLPSLNERLKERGLEPSLSLVGERISVRGGVVLRRGAMKVNKSVDATIAESRERLEPEVAAILFEGEGDAK